MSKKAVVEVKRGKGRPKGSTNATRPIAVGVSGYQVDLDALAKAIKNAVSGPVTVTAALETAEGKQFTLEAADGKTSQTNGDGVMLFRDMNAVAKAVLKRLA